MRGGLILREYLLAPFPEENPAIPADTLLWFLADGGTGVPEVDREIRREILRRRARWKVLMS